MPHIILSCGDVMASPVKKMPMGVMNPTLEPTLNAKVQGEFKNLSIDAFTKAKIYRDPSRPGFKQLDIPGISQYLPANCMGVTLDVSKAISGLPDDQALAELVRLANYTAAFYGNRHVEMNIAAEPELEVLSKGKGKAPEPLPPPDSDPDLNETHVTKAGDKLSVLHPTPFVEVDDDMTGERVILKKKSRTNFTQKYIVYQTSDGHTYRIKRGSLGALVPSSAFPAVVNFLQVKKDDLEGRAKAIQLVLSATDAELGLTTAQWLKVLYQHWKSNPTPENKSALAGAINEFWATAKNGRSHAWKGICQRYNPSLGIASFIPQRYRPIANEKGEVDISMRVKDLSYAAAASGGRAVAEHGRITLRLGSNLVTSATGFLRTSATTAANTAKRAARRAKKAASDLSASIENVADKGSNSANVNSYVGNLFAEVKALVSSATKALFKPLLGLVNWFRA